MTFDTLKKRQTRIFVTGNDTGVGKTVISAILVQALGADYWKPVQAGDLDNSDTLSIRKLVTRTDVQFHPEAFRLTLPMSPHAAAERDGLQIKLAQMQCPETNNRLIIEGAGGVLVPLSRQRLIIDLIAQTSDTTVIVSKHYLGSINHTLLTIEALRQRDVKIAGIIFNGESNPDTESIILQMTAVNLIGRIVPLAKVDSGAIRTLANSMKDKIDEFI